MATRTNQQVMREMSITRKNGVNLYRHRCCCGAEFSTVTPLDNKNIMVKWKGDGEIKCLGAGAPLAAFGTYDWSGTDWWAN